MQYDDPNAIVTCAVCEESSKVGDCTKRESDGVLECALCGAPIESAPIATTNVEIAKENNPDVPMAADVKDPPAKAPATVEDNDQRVERADEIPPGPPRSKTLPFQAPMTETRARTVLGVAHPPEHVPAPETYCGECGAQWPIVDGKIWPNCGHEAPSVDSPTKANKYNPPAGASRARVLGRTLYVTRGRATFPTVAYGSFHIGPFNLSAELGPDANIIEVARSLRADLKKIADEAFEEELNWYEQKLATVKGEE
jgi:hypothetical protein